MEGSACGMVRKKKWSTQVESHLLDRGAVCCMFGGSRPINAATLYRGIKQGRFPQPIKVGGSSRWLRSECEVALQAMVDGRAQ
jgi:predicted DNA-binding transcriptional regulator AlpA